LSERREEESRAEERRGEERRGYEILSFISDRKSIITCFLDFNMELKLTVF
jgi:hypothetical protein